MYRSQRSDGEYFAGVGRVPMMTEPTRRSAAMMCRAAAAPAAANGDWPADDGRRSDTPQR